MLTAKLLLCTSQSNNNNKNCVKDCCIFPYTSTYNSNAIANDVPDVLRWQCKCSIDCKQIFILKGYVYQILQSSFMLRECSALAITALNMFAVALSPLSFFPTFLYNFFYIFFYFICWFSMFLAFRLLNGRKYFLFFFVSFVIKIHYKIYFKF